MGLPGMARPMTAFPRSLWPSPARGGMVPAFLAFGASKIDWPWRPGHEAGFEQAALIRSRYDDGGYSGGSTDRPDLQKLLDDIRAQKIDVIVVYKVDRLTRSLADFAKLVELFDAHGVSFVSVTQQFNRWCGGWRRITSEDPMRK